MTISWIWAGMVTAALLCGLFFGTLDAVAAAALSGAKEAVAFALLADCCVRERTNTLPSVTGASEAVTLAISIAGLMCFWSGVMEVLRACGLADKIAALFRPLLRRLLPNASRDTETLAAVSANVSANLLGLGNAATPLGIQAARRMARNCGGTASDELCLLVVCNTASIQLLPTTVASVRAAFGSAAPFDILPAVWVSSIASVTVGLLTARLLSRRRGGRL